MKFLDVLLVDENHDDCALFGIAVDKSGLNIFLQTVTDGEQAIDYLEGRGLYADRSRHPVPGLVVLDLDIRLTGRLDFLNWRRTWASFSSLPLVIFSDFAYKGMRETALAMGANAFIAKPFVYEDLEAVVHRIWNLGMQPSEPVKRAFGPDTPVLAGRRSPTEGLNEHEGVLAAPGNGTILHWAKRLEQEEFRSTRF